MMFISIAHGENWKKISLLMDITNAILFAMLLLWTTQGKWRRSSPGGHCQNFIKIA